AVRADDRGDAARRRREAQLIDRPQRAERLAQVADLDHAPAFLLAAKVRRSRPHKPSGRNSTKTMKMTPSTSRCRSVWLPIIDSKNVMMTLPMSGPISVPTPPTSDITTALVETSKPNRCGATKPRNIG